jgi:Leucine-rich repeat (LRR) protein
MKSLFSILFLFFLVNGHCWSQNKVYIPDPNFRSVLNTTYPTYMDASGDSLYTDSAALVTTIFSCAGQNVSDASGLEWFYNVQWLYCNNNLLTSLPDLSAFTNLKWLHCYDNFLTSLPDLSASTGLRQLHCQNNQLTALPNLVSPNFFMEQIYCEYNQITALPNLNLFYSLNRLYCNDNQLTSLPNLGGTNLERLYAWRNQLTSLSTLPFSDLKIFSCAQNKLTSLPNFSMFTALEELYCGANDLTSLPDFSAVGTLKKMDCRTNKLDFSDVDAILGLDNLPLMTLFFYDNQKPFEDSLSVSKCEGDSLVLTIMKQDSAISYLWFKDGNFLAGEEDTILVIPAVTGSDAGVYTCRSFGTALSYPPMNFGPGIYEFTSENFTVVVNAVPSTSLSAFSHTCYYEPPFDLSGGLPVGGIYSIDGVPADVFNASLEGTGVHQISYTLDLGGNCTSTSVQPLTVDTSYHLLNASLEICAGDSISIYGNYQYESGVYFDSLLTIALCDSVIETVLIVHGIDTSLSLSGDTLFAVSGYESYQWVDCMNGFPLGGATSSFFPVDSTGSYYVIASNAGCIDSSHCYFVNIATLLENQFDFSFEVFPNPVEGAVTLHFERNIGKGSLVLTDVSGKELTNSSFENEKNVQVEMNSYPPGAYFLKVNVGPQYAVIKLLKN